MAKKLPEWMGKAVAAHWEAQQAEAVKQDELAAELAKVPAKIAELEKRIDKQDEAIQELRHRIEPRVDMATDTGYRPCWGDKTGSD